MQEKKSYPIYSVQEGKDKKYKKHIGDYIETEEDGVVKFRNIYLYMFPNVRFIIEKNDEFGYNKQFNKQTI